MYIIYCSYTPTGSQAKKKSYDNNNMYRFQYVYNISVTYISIHSRMRSVNARNVSRTALL